MTTLFTMVEKLEAKKNAHQETPYFKKFRKMSFYEFNHAIGLPTKNGIPLPLFDYEYKLFAKYQTKKKIWVKKSTGLGITEFTLRWIAWKACTDKRLAGYHVIIITGPNIDLAQKLIGRLKGLFKDYEFTSKNTVAKINDVTIEAFPSHHLASARGLNPKIVFLDEADFFPPGQQDESRAIAERYLAKNQATIIMVSTPNNPGDLFDRMEHEKNLDYEMIFLPYSVGVGKIFTAEDIQLAKSSPTFEREYNLQYGVGSGNIFDSVYDCVGEFDLSLSHGQKLLAVDPAYGSSNFAMTGFEKLENVIYIKTAIEIERPSPVAMVDFVIKLAESYGKKVLVDSAHPGLIRDLIERGVTALPVNFRQELSNMTIQSAQAVKERRVMIHKSQTQLIAQLRAAQFNDKGHPDKTKINFDLGDTFMMGVNHLKTSHIEIIKI